MSSLTLLFSLSFSLFLLMDPIGNIPIYLSILKEIPPKRQRKIILRELLIALGVIIIFIYIGDLLFDLLKISQETVYMAGGIILFIIALKMIFPPANGKNLKETKEHTEPFIVPLAIPMVAGPAILAAIFIYAHQNPAWLLICAVVIAWLATLIILLGASFLEKILGKRGIIACERLMGLILILISVQMFLTGLKSFFLQS